MRTIAQWTEEYIKQVPFLYDQLLAGTVNVSALARKMKPDIEHALLKSVSEGSLVMALKRNLKKNRTISLPVPQLWNELTLRSHLVEFAFTNNPHFHSVQQKLIALKTAAPDTFLNISQGVFETTILASDSLAKDIRALTSDQPLLATLSDLSAITLRFSPESVSTHSVYARILAALSWEAVNIVEVISIYTELTLVFRSEDIKKAFHVIESLESVSSMKKV